ncbi:mitochondrial carrier domain-containing protein [Gamsiella multidivaricata]|uniref:mitochondrial carrier domain-containing protein n=1 Tax=Gamsiella multidivaricata TaxID=101098 RepID=UPI00221F6B49|nr:mitochondrial carrier domain-containing protein [Gamsiella multidivaricata]KAG0364239.1 mitochondrial thiamine pyrophosphate transporter [Gamsiella multidivaricata]KAI7821415.1 mitochondrial carrier domain-containing protein [Gamsiella multidivaricata]
MAESGFATLQGNPSSSLVDTVANASHSITGTTSSTVAATSTAENSSHERKSIAAGGPKLSKLETVLCGSTAGVVSRFVIAPLDVVKIRLQLQTERKELPKVLRRMSFSDPTSSGLRSRTGETVNGLARPTNLPAKYKGMFSGMATIAREEGIRGLWKGNMAAEYLYLTYGGIQFLVYQQMKSFLSNNSERSVRRATVGHMNGIPLHIFTTLTTSSSAQSFISGATAGVMATACTYPFDLLRTRFAIQRDVKVYTGVLQAFRHILQKDGIQGFYRGMTPALIQVVPYMGVMFGSYDTLKQLASWLKTKANLTPMQSLPRPNSSVDLKSKERTASTSDPPIKTLGTLLLGLEDMLCGAISGVISKTVVYPLDMVRKRLQIQGSEQQKVNLGVFTSQTSSVKPVAGAAVLAVDRTIAKTVVEALPTSVWKCMVHIVKQEGYLALYKGLLPGILKAAPASAVTFLVFSQTGSLIERVRQPSAT